MVAPKKKQLWFSYYTLPGVRLTFLHKPNQTGNEHLPSKKCGAECLLFASQVVSRAAFLKEGFGGWLPTAKSQ